MQILQIIYEEIQSALILPEMGGILGADASGIVTNFYHDKSGVTTAKNYIPDVEILNGVISDWSKIGVRFAGFVHSHSPQKISLSKPDVAYARKIKKYCALEEILMLLYIPAERKFFRYIL